MRLAIFVMAAMLMVAASWSVGADAPGVSTGSDFALTTVPEAASMLLLGTGLAGVAAAARRRRHKKHHSPRQSGTGN